MLEIIIALGVAGIGGYLHKIGKDISTIKDNHLVHIARDIRKIDVRLSVVESKVENK